MNNRFKIKPWNLIAELTDKNVLGLDGMSNKVPRKTSRAIVMNEDGKYAVMYAEKFNLYSLPGGGIEEGEDEISTLIREIYEETGCICDFVEQLGIVSENRNHQDYTTLSYYFVVHTKTKTSDTHLTEAEIENGTSVKWFSLEETLHRIRDAEHETTQRKFLQARDLAALTEYCRRLELKQLWQSEESIAHIHGWDFSHINGRYEEGNDIPWNYEDIIHQYLTPDARILDFDTGGGEFLLSLNHPYNKTAATEGFPPNVQLCKETLLPLGIDFKECNDAANIPFEDESFDIIINRHGDFNAKELHRLLKKGGLFITQQVGSENDRELVEMVLPGTPKQFPDLNLTKQKNVFEEAGFEILQAEEAFLPIKFYDVGAFVWFARIIEWEFPGFSVDKCFDKLLEMQKTIEEQGEVAGTTHRYLIVARK
ncbi:MAG: NUDIX domain-containing protein [Lachnospiraceae bacterium]|nr:NUDIX domain-containing protein [Lachnospiraceae bacterium]